MHPKVIFVTLVLVTMTSQFTTHSVILRPDWFPYFREDKEDGQIRGERALMDNIPCPSDMTEYECYHTYMAVWTRLLQKDKRSKSSSPDDLAGRLDTPDLLPRLI